jgi:site-specific DNA recombinase
MGKLFDEQGTRLSPNHAIKNGRRYRYYVSRELLTGTSQEAPRGWRLPALQIEKLVASEAANILNDRSGVAAALEKNRIPADQSPSALAVAERLRACLLSEVERPAALLSLIDRVELGRGILRVTISFGALLGDGHAGIMLTRELPLVIKRRGVEMRLVSDSHNASPAKADPILLKEVARAHRCFDALLTGRASSIAAVAAP